MKVVLHDHNGILKDLKPHFEIVKTIQEAEVVVLWQDVMMLGLSTAKTAKRLGKPVIVVQHGRNSTTDYCPPKNHPLTADKICVWGVKDRDRLLKAGIPKSKIKITGTTIFSHLIGRKPHKGTNIVFCPHHWDSEIKENYIVADVLRKIKVNIITKVIETNKSDKFDNPVFSNRDKEDHLDVCADVLSKADLVVSLSDSTFSLLAFALNIPVIIVDILRPYPFLRKPAFPEVYAKACDVVELPDLEKAIKENLKNPDKLQDERSDIAMIEGGIYIKNPLQKIIDVIYA